ncbi:MAG: hypothetical protein ABSG42_08740 [Nitrospirota bacterium]
MKWKEISLHARLNIVSAAITVVGLGISFIIYLTAGNADEDGMMTEFEGSKRYIHDLELFGGRSNVIAVQFTHWFEGLWHGRSLALTIACITIFISFVFFFLAHHLSEYESDDQGENNRDGGS